jgi:hypothetical protein
VDASRLACLNFDLIVPFFFFWLFAASAAQRNLNKSLYDTAPTTTGNNEPPTSPASSTNSDMNLLLATPTKPAVTQNELDIMETRSSPAGANRQNSTNTNHSAPITRSSRSSLNRSFADESPVTGKRGASATATAPVTNNTSTNSSNSNSPKSGVSSMRSIKNDVRLFSPENRSQHRVMNMMSMLTQRQLQQQAGVRNAMISADLNELSPEHLPQMDHGELKAVFLCLLNFNLGQKNNH